MITFMPSGQSASLRYTLIYSCSLIVFKMQKYQFLCILYVTFGSVFYGYDSGRCFYLVWHTLKCADRICRLHDINPRLRLFPRVLRSECHNHRRLQLCLLWRLLCRMHHDLVSPRQNRSLAHDSDIVRNFLSWRFYAGRCPQLPGVLHRQNHWRNCLWNDLLCMSGVCE